MICAFASKAALLSIRQAAYLQIEKNFQLHVAKPDKSLSDIRAEREKELLEIGGDPFFLTDDDLIDDSHSDDEENDGASMPSLSLLAMSGVGNVMADVTTEGEGSTQQNDAKAAEEDFLWDGEIDESAYFDYN